MRQARPGIPTWLRRLSRTVPGVTGSKTHHWLRFLYVHRRPPWRWSQAFTSKIVRYMRSDYVSRLQPYVDKLAVRDFVTATVGRHLLPDVYAEAARFEDLNFESAPDRFYLKSNHGQGYNIPVPSKSTMDLDACRRQVTENLASPFDRYRQRQYEGIARRVYLEEFLDTDGPDRWMLRVYMFDGQPAFIVSESLHGSLVNGYHLPDWAPAPFRIGPRPHASRPRPHNLDEVLQVSRQLADGFPFVRVDLYWLAGRIVFSELTFSPSAGLRRVTPTVADRELGRRFVLPKAA